MEMENWNVGLLSKMLISSSDDLPLKINLWILTVRQNRVDLYFVNIFLKISFHRIFLLGAEIIFQRPFHFHNKRCGFGLKKQSYPLFGVSNFDCWIPAPCTILCWFFYCKWWVNYSNAWKQRMMNIWWQLVDVHL